MVDTKEDNQPVTAIEPKTKFIRSPKGMILALEMVLCFIAIICKAASYGCYLWCPIVELVWAIIIFVIYGMELQIRFFPWTDFFRAITGSLTLLITSILCLSWTISLSSGEVAGAIFGLMAAAVFGYDTFCITKQIKEMREQGISLRFEERALIFSVPLIRLRCLKAWNSFSQELKNSTTPVEGLRGAGGS